MQSLDRRSFLVGLGRAGATVAAASASYRISGAGRQADFARTADVTLTPPAAGSRMTFKLPPRSYTVVQLSLKT
jgi:hypothetical protein